MQGLITIFLVFESNQKVLYHPAKAFNISQNTWKHIRRQTKSWWRHQMKTFSALLVICAWIHRSPVNFPHKGQWRGALMFSLICVWINGWVNTREGSDLRRYRAHYDVTVINIPHPWSAVYTCRILREKYTHRSRKFFNIKHAVIFKMNFTNRYLYHRDESYKKHFSSHTINSLGPSDAYMRQ